MTKPLDLTGQQFERLTVLRRIENNRHGKARWLCLCACGREYEVLGALLVRGGSKSCGCLKSERAKRLKNDLRGYDVLTQYVVTPEGCHEWTGHRGAGGYGVTRYEGRHWKAHRLSYARRVGPIPKGMYVLHHCDNPPCINPAHLWLGTQTDNMRDMIAKGRRVLPYGRLHREAGL